MVKEVGSDSVFVKTDVTKAADVNAMVEKTIEHYGRLDYAFNNAGIEQAPSPLLEQTEETFGLVKDNQQVQEQVMAMHPIGRAGKSEEIASAVAWLCCDVASFVTGQTLALDGRFTAQ